MGMQVGRDCKRTGLGMGSVLGAHMTNRSKSIPIPSFPLWALKPKNCL